MRNVLISLAFIGATTAVACRVQVGSDPQPNTPANASAQSTPANTPGQTAATPTSNPATAGRTLGKRKILTPTPTTTSTAVPTATTAVDAGAGAPAGVPVVNAVTPFGGGTPDPTGWKGTISKIPAGTTKLPAMASQQAAGYVFIKELNIGARAFTEGFPGVDANLKENFAIRYEAPLVVTNGGDYEFRLAADDGAVLLIDGTLIVDNDGKHEFKDVTGPVHLVTGTHVMTVDYFQTTGNVGLQLFCKKMGEATDKVCGTSL